MPRRPARTRAPSRGKFIDFGNGFFAVFFFGKPRSERTNAVPNVSLRALTVDARVYFAKFNSIARLLHSELFNPFLFDVF